MRNRAFLKVALLGLLTFALSPGLAAASGQGQDLTEMLASNTAARASAVSGPIIALSPSSLDFGIVNNGSTAMLLLEVSNTGDAFLNVFSIVSTDPAFTTGTIPGGGLAPGASVMLPVSFSPTDGFAHAATLTFDSDASNGDLSVNLSGQGNDAPVMDPISTPKSAIAFATLSFMVVATDDTDTVDDQVTYSMVSDLPIGAAFNVNTGEFSWTPNGADAGTYSATFGANDGRASATPQTISIVCTVPNNPPVADAGGPYLGATGQPLQFNGTGSSDPDPGQTLSYAWTFGDGGTGTGPTPSHTYAAPGNYIASLTVTDNGTPSLSSTAVAGVTIKTEIICDLFLKNNASSVRAHGGGRLRVAIQETDRPLTDIVTTSIKMHTDFPNAGSVAEISATKKGGVIGDLNLDQVADLTVEFNIADLSDLLSNVPNNTTVNLIVTGDFQVPTGTIPLRGTKAVTAKTGGGGLVSSSAFPNPFNPETSISFTVRREGYVSVRIFSIDGRLVRTLKENEFTSAGTHEVRWNGMDNAGRAATSGVYFVQSVLNNSQRSITKISLMK